MDPTKKNRNKAANSILFTKRIGQQFMVTQFAKVDWNYLSHINIHQKDL